MSEIVLLVQGDAVTANIIAGALCRSGGEPLTIEWVELLAEGIDRLQDDPFKRIAAVLLYLHPPNGKGIDAFNMIFKASRDVPVLLICSVGTQDVASQAVRLGAQDYLLERDLPGYLLPKAVRNMIERAANAEKLHTEKERVQVTLNSIGDAVVSTDAAGNIIFLNPIAEVMTGWSLADAVGQPFSEILRIVDGTKSHRTVNPMLMAIQQDKVAHLPTGCLLIRRDGLQSPIEDSAAPIHDRRGRVTGGVMVFHDVTESRAILTKMSHLAQHDYLTDLPNRLLLNDRLSQAISTARRQKQHLAVLFVDIDRFKHVNDSLGHVVGDKLLLSIAARLSVSIRSSDTVSRQGGDEFVVLLSSVAHAEDAALSAQRMLTTLSMPHQIEMHDLQISASVGISIYPEDGVDAQTLVKSADIAMLNAKDNGRNGYQFFKPNMNEHALERQSLESALRHALDRHEFILHYQPKVDLVTEALTGAEALIRWYQPQRGLVCPKDFISIAEQCGYIVAIGQWVIREACRQRKAWLNANLAPVPVAVNVSAVELRSKNFVDLVRAILEETGLDPQYLEFELTETALIQDPHTTITVLRALRDLGIRLSLDDFGTGYSSLSHLKRFPIDALKLDKSFVRGLCSDSGDAKIVSAVINMGRSFHLRVIAEGVETRAQFLALKGQDCAEGQGYYFQEPVPANEFIKLLGEDLSETVFA